MPVTCPCVNQVIKILWGLGGWKTAGPVKQFTSTMPMGILPSLELVLTRVARIHPFPLLDWPTHIISALIEENNHYATRVFRCPLKIGLSVVSVISTFGFPVLWINWRLSCLKMFNANTAANLLDDKSYFMCYRSSMFDLIPFLKFQQK